MFIFLVVEHTADNSFITAHTEEANAYKRAFDQISDIVKCELDYYEDDERYTKLLKAIKANDHKKVVSLWNDDDNKITVDKVKLEEGD